MCIRDRIKGGQPSIIQPIAGPWDSPQVVKRKNFPNVLNDIIVLYKLFCLNYESKKLFRTEYLL